MSRDARVLAAHYYAGSPRRLAADMAALSRNPQGIIMYTPQLVVLMKPVLSGRPQEWQELDTPSPGADAWYVHLLAGELHLALTLGHLLPELPLLCFQRGSRSSIIHRHRWLQTLQRGNPNTLATSTWRNTTTHQTNNT